MQSVFAGYRQLFQVCQLYWQKLQILLMAIIVLMDVKLFREYLQPAKSYHLLLKYQHSKLASRKRVSEIF